MKCSPATTKANRPKAAAETNTSKKNMEFLLVTAPEKPLSNLNMHQQCWPHQLLSSATSLRHKQGASMLVLNLHEGYVLSLPTFSLLSCCGHLSENMVSTVLSCSYHTSFVLASALLTCWASGCAAVQYSLSCCHLFWFIFGNHFSWIYYFLGNKSSSLAGILAWNA